MRHLSRLPKTYRIPIKPDVEGYIGRECPEKSCKGYFKITLSTGLDDTTVCHCPYCGHKGEQEDFLTRAQLEYASSVVANKATDAFLKDMKSLEFDYPARGAFGIGFSMKVKGTPHPIRHYREKQLETPVICDRCGLRYAIYGVFAYCPDCGVHNSLQILDGNLELVEKQLGLAEREAEGDPELSAQLIVNSLEDVVSAFDGFGREACRVSARIAASQEQPGTVSFQNLERARKRLYSLCDVDLAVGIEKSQWELAVRCFQKRHLPAHKMGVVDRKYLEETKDPSAVVGRKVSVTSDEVRSLMAVVKTLGRHLVQQLGEPSAPEPPEVTG